MALFDLQKSREVFFFFRPPSHRQKIDNLDEERVSAARLPHYFNQFAQARNETVVSDAQQRPARDVAHARGFDHNRAGTPLGESPVPVEDVLRDETFFGRPPGPSPGPTSGSPASRARRESERTTATRRLLQPSASACREVGDVSNFQDATFDCGLGLASSQ